jgi:hypothetical protein
VRSRSSIRTFRSRTFGPCSSLGARDDRFTEPYGVDAFIVGEAFFDGYPGRVFANRTIADYLELCGLTRDYTYRERRVGGETVADFVFDTPAAGGEGGSVFHFGLIEGLAHQYPNGRNHPLRIADPLWDFFRTRSLRSP